MEEMEHLLSVWIEYQTRKQSNAVFLRVKENTITMYGDIKKKKMKIPQKCLHLVEVVAGLVASRTTVVSTVLNCADEAVSADEEAAKTFPPALRN